jgi:osmotically-inducible protein OsmY
MARRHDKMSEEEAREEMARRNHPYERDPYGRDDGRGYMPPIGYGRGALYGAGYGWPLMPPSYPDSGYGPRDQPRDDWRRGGGGYNDTPRGMQERDMMDRAGDEIASWFGDDAAQERREADHRGRGPKGYVRSDARIEEDVNDRLTDDRAVDASEIAVTVKDREVTLNGTVDSRRAKRHAEDCAESVSGVVHVQNNLRVQTA